MISNHHTNLGKQGNSNSHSPGEKTNTWKSPIPLPVASLGKDSCRVRHRSAWSVLSAVWQRQAQGHHSHRIGLVPISHHLPACSQHEVCTHTGAKVRPLHGVVALLLERLVIKSGHPSSCSLRPLCGQERLFLQCSGSSRDPGLCQGDSDSA